MPVELLGDVFLAGEEREEDLSGVYGDSFIGRVKRKKRGKRPAGGKPRTGKKRTGGKRRKPKVETASSFTTESATSAPPEMTTEIETSSQEEEIE